MADEKEKTGLDASSIDGLTSQLREFSKLLSLSKEQTEQLTESLNKMARLSLVGLGAYKTGQAALQFLQGPIEQAKRYQTELERTKLLLGSLDDGMVKRVQAMDGQGLDDTQKLNLYGKAADSFGNKELANF